MKSNEKKLTLGLVALYLAFVFFGGLIMGRGSFVFADDNADKLGELNRQIEEYERQIKDLKSKANTLSNQIAQFNAQIKLTELKINQTQEQITLLGGRIDQLRLSLADLQNAFQMRAVETYRLSRTNEIALLFLSLTDLRQAMAKYHYLIKIQEADRNLLTRLQAAQETYTNQKTELEDLNQVLGVQKETLDNQKNSKNNLLGATRNDEKKFQQLLSEAKAQLSALRRYVLSQGGASILQNQTKCDGWGCYFNQRDSQWGNIGLGGSSYSMAEYGCLVTSVSMIASHVGRNIKPSDIAINSNFFVPGPNGTMTGYLYHNAEGMPFSLTVVSKNSLDSELAKGPVIAGLFSGPDHFIVILRKEGDNYIMHDPFLENGSNRPLTDKYTISNISSLRIVSFN